MLIVLTDSRRRAFEELERRSMDPDSVRIVTTAEEARNTRLEGNTQIIQIGDIDDLLYELAVKG